MASEHVLTIPLRNVYKAPLTKRAKVAIRVLREFVARHTKAQIIKISPQVNELIWSRGIKRPPRRVRVKVELRDEDGVKIAEVKLPEVKEEGESSA